MSTTTLHLLSRGRAPEHDYQWVAVEPEPHPPRQERPPRLDARAAQLVQSDSPSLLLLRVGGELVLFITALESTRTDVQGRPIRTAIAMTVSDNEQDTLRGLAALALREGGRRQLESMVDETVVAAPDGGFDVSFELMQRLLDTTLPQPDEDPELERRFGPNDAAGREALAEEIARCALPFGEGPLVVVTGALASDRLEDSGAWRGLSRLVPAPFERPPPEVRSSPKKDPAAVQRRTLFLLGAAVMLLILIWSLLPPETP